LHRYIQTHLETPLAKLIISGELADGTAVTLDESGGELIFS
jgi:ATP-dependent Clp protease ATP-binding subunit ClpB